MPDILLQWNQWWLDLWVSHPALWWSGLALCAVASFASSYLRRRF